MVNNNIKVITEKLFYHEKIRLSKIVNLIIKENYILGGISNGFFFLNKYYSIDGSIIKKKQNKHFLHVDLIPRMNLYVLEENKINYDRSKIEQMLSIVLKNCKSLQDIRNALPNCITIEHDEMKNLDRTDKEAYTVIDNPRIYKQYLNTKSLIEFYTSAKLLY